MRGVISTQTALVILIITIAGTILAALAVFVWFQTRPPSSDASSTSSNPFSIFYGKKPVVITPIVSTTTTSATISVALKDGGVTTVRDFLNDPGVLLTGTSTTDGGYYIVAASYPEGIVPIPGGEDPKYQIDYFPGNSSFSIYILQEPVGDVRREAIADLSARIGVSGSELCSLVIEVGTPVWVNEYFGARSLGVPGCSGSVEISGDPKF